MKVAAVDIGTNTVRLLLADVVSVGSGVRIASSRRHEVITRLGEGLDSSGRLGTEPMERALAGLAHYSQLIVAADVRKKAGVATAATRSADNGADFVARAGEVLGFEPRVIDGVEEAHLTFVGATNGAGDGGTRCVIDVGGGSTEFVVGRRVPNYAVSVDIGSVRLTERIERLPLAGAEQKRGYVDQLFRNVVSPDPVTEVLGSGGTFVTLAAVHLGVDPKLLDRHPGFTISLPELRATTNRLLDMTVEQIAELPSVAPARAAVLQAGAICAERAATHIGLPTVVVSVSDLLDGVALRLFAEESASESG